MTVIIVMMDTVVVVHQVVHEQTAGFPLCDLLFLYLVHLYVYFYIDDQNCSDNHEIYEKGYGYG